MRARKVAIVAGLVGGLAWMAKLVVMGIQGGPDPDSVPEAIAFFLGLVGVVVAAAALGAYRARGGSPARTALYAVGAVVVTVAVVGLGQLALTALPGDTWVQEEAIFGAAGLVAVLAAAAAFRPRADAGS